MANATPELRLISQLTPVPNCTVLITEEPVCERPAQVADRRYGIC